MVKTKITIGAFALLLTGFAVYDLVRRPPTAAPGRAGASASPSPTHAESARVGFEPSLIDFGDQPWLSRLPFEARFVNQSPQPVTILAIKPSCGCIGIDTTACPAEVPARTEFLIHGQMQLDSIARKQSEALDVLMDGGAVYTVALRANVNETYTVVPDEIDFGDVDISSQALTEAKILRFSSASSNLESVAVDAAWLLAALGEEAERKLAMKKLAVLPLAGLLAGTIYLRLQVGTAAADCFKPVSSACCVASSPPNTTCVCSSQSPGCQCSTTQGQVQTGTIIECNTDFWETTTGDFKIKKGDAKWCKRIKECLGDPGSTSCGVSENCSVGTQCSWTLTSLTLRVTRIQDGDCSGGGGDPE